MTQNRKARRRAAALARQEGSRTSVARRQDSRGFLRAAMLGTAAAGALIAAHPQSADAGPGPCLPPGGITVTCTGDQSDGIASGTDFNALLTRTLNVNNLTQDIAPAAGISGISFDSFLSVTINSDTTDGPGGPFEISTTGDFADGIYADSDVGSVRVTHTGDITTDGDFSIGIFADSDIVTTRVTHTGNVNTLGDFSRGISAAGATGVTVNQTGDITTRGYTSRALYAATELEPRASSRSAISIRVMTSQTDYSPCP